MILFPNLWNLQLNTCIKFVNKDSIPTIWVNLPYIGKKLNIKWTFYLK